MTTKNGQSHDSTNATSDITIQRTFNLIMTSSKCLASQPERQPPQTPLLLAVRAIKSKSNCKLRRVRPNGIQAKENFSVFVDSINVVICKVWVSHSYIQRVQKREELLNHKVLLHIAIFQQNCLYQDIPYPKRKAVAKEPCCVLMNYLMDSMLVEITR